MRQLSALACILLATAAVHAATPPLGNGYGAIDAPRDTDPATLGALFCAARLSGDMAPVAPFFAAKLARLVAGRDPAAIPWQSHPDHATGCSAAVDGADDIIGVLVTITYTAPGRTWSDTLNLERTPDSWRINNVFYAQGGNLRFRLVTEPDA